MKRLLFILIIFTLFFNKKAFSTWTDLNTGINDSLTGVVFWGDNGMVSGKKGLYYTTNGGVGSSSWSRFNIINNSSDSIIYNNTKFSHCYSTNGYTDYVFACGSDTVNNLAVIVQIQFPSLTHHIVYHGNNLLDTTTSDVKLNNINYCSINDEFYAVGNNRLIIQFDTNSNGNQITNNAILNSSSFNFKSIDFRNGYFSIAADNFSIVGYDIDIGVNFNIQNSLGDSISDVKVMPNNEYLRVGNKILLTSQFSAPNTIHTDVEFVNYSFGSINANAVFQYNNYFFIGTNHGIFRESSPYSNIYERQVSSLSSSINEFWDDISTSNIYACGNGGIVYYSTSDGGGSIPYIAVNQEGGCVGQDLPFSVVKGSVHNCLTYIDNALVNSSCSLNYFPNISTPGTYQIKVVVSNPYGIDSSEINFIVVDTPRVNLPFSVNDNILCKEESINITIDSAQQHVYYELFNSSSQETYGFSIEGNDSTISFLTNLISESGVYHLRAKSSLVECYLDFSDSLVLEVEKTKAKFHTGLINAKIGESVNFYEHCVDADNYEWLFPSISGYDTSNLSTPIHAFDLTGNQSIVLKCWSNNGCSDSIIKTGPYVYLTPNIYDSTWVNIGRGVGNRVGHQNSQLSEMNRSRTGYITSGKFYNQVFPTKIGDSLFLNDYGAYVNKYSKHGVLKWNIKSNRLLNANHTFSINSTIEDNEGNIYASGYINEFFVDNTGDTIRFDDNVGILIKLDSLGKAIWYRSFNSMNLDKIELDNSNNLLVSMSFLGNSFSNIVHSSAINGIVTDTIVLAESKKCIAKISDVGGLIWYVPIDLSVGAFSSVKFDNSNNMYVAGVNKYKVYIYSTDGTMDSIKNYGNDLNIFVIKFDSLGVLQWKIKSRTINVSSDLSSVNDMEVDSNGNIYLSGSNDCYSNGNSLQIFENTDGSVTSHRGGKYFVSKVNSDGVCQWINSAEFSYYGYGINLELKDDSLFVLGVVRGASSGFPIDVKFNSEDYSYFPLTIYAGNYFLATYDTSGILYDVLVSNGAQNYFSIGSFNGMFIDETNNFYLASNFNNSSSQSYLELGHSIPSTNGSVPKIIKFNKSQGIHVLPSYEVKSDTTICRGSSYTLPNGTVLNNLNSAYYDTLALSSSIGTDSVVITFIHVAPDYNNINENIYLCAGQGYTFPDGSFIDSINSTYTHINYLSSVYGCDSIVTSILRTAFDYEQIDSVLTCYNSDYIFPDSVILFNVDTVVSHISQLQTKHGCDSVVTTVLIPNYSNDSVIDSVFVCFNSNYTFIDGTSVNNVTSTQMHESHLQSIHGCDSLVKEVLVPVSIDAYVTQNENVLICVTQVDSSLLNYTWIDCYNNNAPIIGENLSQYVVNEDGSYGVIISYNNCSDTSQCLNVLGLGISADEEFNLDIHPNPTKGSLVINLPNNHNLKKMILTNTLGETILEKEVFKLETIQLVIESAPGVYFANFINQKGVKRSIKVVKH